MTTFNTCVICPDIIPPCQPCNSGQTCVIIAASCHVCSYTECLDNAEVSSGHYTIGSTAAIGPFSTTVTQASQTTSASNTTSLSSVSSTSSSTVATTASSTSSGSMASTSSAAAISTPLTSIASSVGTQVTSLTTSSTSTPSTGVAATIGPHTMEGQGLLWIVMAFWLGTAVFGERRWRM